ncbi:MAG: PEP-CTERM sorting domain-containing protein [Planctomycetota bacterium]
MSSVIRLSAAAAIAASLFVAEGAHAQNSAVINFVGNLETYTGTPFLDPDLPGTPVNQLVNGEFPTWDPTLPPGSVAEPLQSNSLDWLRFQGQIVIPDFQGDGRYIAQPDGMGFGGAGIYLHNPVLNRIETVSLRTEGPLTGPSAALAGRVDGDELEQRDDIYLPDFTPNGVAIIDIAGDNVTISYELDFLNLPRDNAEFFRDGVTPTDISNIVTGVGERFLSIGVEGGGTAMTTTATIGTNDQSIPYGAYFTFEPVVGGNLGNTIVDLTVGILETEIAANNISSNGLNNADTVFLTELPAYGAPGGTVTFFDLTMGPDLSVSVATSPEPASALLVMVSAAGLAARRRRG